VFWFTLFHEVGHLLLRHSKKEVFISFEQQTASPEEDEANRFAQDALIPPAELRAFRSEPYHLSRGSILRFAEKIGVAPAVVVGRLQHEGDLPRGHLSDLRPRLRWASDGT
jgi:Zn-dependent peptidase ImmA (M78 family)